MNDLNRRRFTDDQISALPQAFHLLFSILRSRFNIYFLEALLKTKRITKKLKISDEILKIQLQVFAFFFDMNTGISFQRTNYPTDIVFGFV